MKKRIVDFLSLVWFKVNPIEYIQTIRAKRIYKRVMSQNICEEAMFVVNQISSDYELGFVTEYEMYMQSLAVLHEFGYHN